MSIPICLFGNSHIAALRTAHLEAPERWSELAPQMVGAHKTKLVQTEVIDGVLRPRTEDAKVAFAKLGGGAGIELDRFEAFVIVGCNSASSNLVRLHRDARFLGMASLKEVEDLAKMEPALLSRSAFETIAVEHMGRRLWTRFAALLREHTDKPIYLCPQPHVSQDAVHSDDPNHVLLQNIAVSGDGRIMNNIHRFTLTELAKDANVTVLSQPKSTISRGIMTKREMSRGSIRLAATGRFEHDRTDYDHANATYGGLVLGQIQEAVLADVKQG
jgi:hypothetical protein